MIDLHKAILAFNKYISYYDKSIPLINLKIVHTFNVMAIMEYLCEVKKLNEEETSLALLIALLHDLGRFEQYRIYKSFEDYKTIDHALFSSELLFKNNKIRDFIDDNKYDDIIKIAIEQHNKYKIDDIKDKKALMFVHLIRDADKLDNFRVKETEKIETLFNISLNELEKEKISDEVYQQFCEHKLIYGPSRKTHLDMWISYIAFIFDLYFDESIQYIYKHHWIDRSFGRVQPDDERYYQLKIEMNKYVEERKNEI
jgi:hypothetical protein